MTLKMILCIKDINDKSAFLKVLKLQDRNNILEVAHLLGLFNALTTVNRINKQYWWPKML